MLRVIGFLPLLFALLVGQVAAKPIAKGTGIAPSPAHNRSSESNTPGMHITSLAYLNPQWKMMPGDLKQLQVDGNVVCGVNKLDDIFCADQDIFNNPNWFKLPGKLMHVSVSNGRLYGVSGEGQLWYGENYKAPKWRQVFGEARMVDLDVNVACHISLRNDNIWCAELGNDFANPQWFQVPGQLKSVSVSIGRLYGVNSLNQVFYAPDFKNAQWKQVAGSLTQVELRGRITCGVNQWYEIFCASGDVSNPQWNRIYGGLKHVSVSNGALYGVNRQELVFSAV